MHGLIDPPVHTQTLQLSGREALPSGAGEELLNFHLKDPQLNSPQVWKKAAFPALQVLFGY